MKANFHTHTPRCHHAEGSERAYIEAAIAHGLTTLGFADHSPYIFSDGHYSGFRMFPEELPEYVETLKALKKEYAGIIEIHIGLEAEYYPDDFPAYIDFLKGKGVEYLILGQHFAGSEKPGVLYSARASDDFERLTTYVDNVVAGAQTGLFSYIAHPDAINYTGDRNVFRKELERLADGVIAADVPFEINILGLREGRNYPNELFLEVLGERRATVILGSDAHSPKYVCDEQTNARAEELVRKYHLTLTEQPDLSRLRKHGI